MNVLIVGGGGREHALVWKTAQSDRVTKVFCAPGNAGTAALAENVALSAEDSAGLLRFAREAGVQLTVVGPEAPLCAGLVDVFTNAGLRIFGPTAAAARLEGDKAYAKQLMKSAAIPTAEGRVFDHYDRAREYVATRESALVVKAAGLAAGKGVLICPEPSDALLALEKIMVDDHFGAAGDRVVVEEYLQGTEVSVQALVDGHAIYVLEPVRDHKRLGVGDTGPNTGGMGAVCPVATLRDSDLHVVYSEILVPVIDALNRQGTPYRGLLYVGLMLTAGGPKVLEFNCRFGDPEAQVLLPRMQTDIVDLFEAVIDGNLEAMTIDWDPRTAVCVVLAAGGYPQRYPTGATIAGIEAAERDPAVTVFHAGTTAQDDTITTNGGRVLGVTALDVNVRAARERAYRAVEHISFEGAYYRADIADAATIKGVR